MTEPNRFVSVVTPFYNTSAYLAECIDSVLAQLHRDFEYVLVDNQSTDGSGAIAAAHAAKDSRIRVVKTPRFFTQVQNYNFALEQISERSAYCKFVQADDWIFPNCLSEMTALGLSHPEAAIISAYEMNDGRVLGTGLHPSRTVISGREACRLFLIGDVYMFGSPTTLLYRSDVVRRRRPFFEEGRLHEDTEVVFAILADEDFGIVHQVLSFTRVHTDSISGAARDFAPDALDRLILVKRYGRRYLDDSEYDACLRGAHALYYGSLARKWLDGRGKDFWEYHRNGLRSAGERIRPVLFGKHLGAALLEGALPPAIVKGMRRRFSHH